VRRTRVSPSRTFLSPSHAHARVFLGLFRERLLLAKEPPRTTPRAQKEHIRARKTSTRALEVLSSRARLRESSQHAQHARAHLSFFFAFFLFLLPFATSASPLSFVATRKNVEEKGLLREEEERRDVRKRRTNARTRRSISFPHVSTLPLHLPETRIFSSTP